LLRGDPAIVYLDGVQPPSPPDYLPSTLINHLKAVEDHILEQDPYHDEDEGPEEYIESDSQLVEPECATSPSPEDLVHIDNPETSVINSQPASVELTMAELELLKRMEEANRLIEADAKSLNCLSEGAGSSKHNGSSSNHSRTSSITSQMSMEVVDNGEDLTLWNTWNGILKGWERSNSKKQPQVIELVRKGIPHHFRGMAWQVLCGAHESSDKCKYSGYLKTQSACEKVIRRDIARTYPEHDFFKTKDGVGQEALFNVMKAYSIHDREVGYCQGSAFIVGLLLMQMPEEDAFAVVVRIMQDYRMREMFKPSMAELGLCMYQLDTLVQEHIPDLYVHFQSQAIHTNLYASGWFLTLYATCVPLNVACRIMDSFLLEGMEVIFRISISLLLRGKQELLYQDMEGVLMYFQKDMPLLFEADTDAILTEAFNLKINHKKMKKVEKEYTTMKSKEKEDEIEIKRLQNENRLLRQRIDMLENESNELADKLIQGQVDRAEVDETTFVIKRELAAVKQHDLDTSRKLEDAIQNIKELESRIDNEADASVTEAHLEEKREILSQKEDMINCLKEELFKARLQVSENEDKIKKLHETLSILEQERRKQREDIPENNVANLQEELAASKLRETEANLALKDLRTKVGELNVMWQKHIKLTEGPDIPNEMPSTPKKILGSFLESGWGSHTKKEEELMTVRLREVEGIAELKELRLKVMGLETQTKVLDNQLSRQDEMVSLLNKELGESKLREIEKENLLLERHSMIEELEKRMKENQLLQKKKEQEMGVKVASLKEEVVKLEWQNIEMQEEERRNLEIAALNQRNNIMNTPDSTPLAEYKQFFPGYK